MRRMLARRWPDGQVVPDDMPVSCVTLSPQKFECRESVAPYRVAPALRTYPRETTLLRCDALALSLRCALERIVPALARAASAFVRAGAWRTFGYARVEDHARERFRRSGRWLRDLSALGEAFDRLPRLAEAVGGGDGHPSIGRVAASIIARAATVDSLEAWIEVARAEPVRSLREMASRARRGGSAWPLPEEVTAPGDDSSATDVGTAFDDEADDPDASPGVQVRLVVPAPVEAAFDEALDLYRAHAGAQTTVTEFVESLVADAQAGPHPADTHVAPLGGHSTDAELLRIREKNLARSTGNWKHLPQDTSAASDWAFALAGMSLTAMKEACSRAGTGGPVELDEQIRSLIHLEDELERRLARLLADMADQSAWVRLRFDSVGHYAEQRLGISRSAAQDRVRALRALVRFPIVRQAYERGDIGLDATLRLVRILDRSGSADEDSQRAWVRRAQEATTKRLRDEERLMLRFHAAIDMTPEVLEAPPDDRAWQSSLCREPGTTRSRISAFGRAALEKPEAGTFFRLRLPVDLASAFLSCVESARARLASLAEEVPWDEPWPESASTSASLLCARMFSIRCRRSPAWVGLLALLEEFAQTWDDPQMSPRRASDAIYVRDGWRCTAPGCTSRRNLEDHHLVYRSRGGSDDLCNRTCLCRFHHQLGEHGGFSSCRGAAPLGILWTLGRDGVGGYWKNEVRMT